MSDSARPVVHFLSLMQTAVASRDSDEALRALVRVRRDLNALERAHVQRALAAGRSWSQIASALGVSKQAAHRRHRAPALGMTLEELVAQGGPRGKVLVTSEARAAVRFAREEAQALGHASVGSEHLLLGLLRCQHSAARMALEAAGVELDAGRVAAQPTLIEAEPVDVSEAGPSDVRSSPVGAFRPHARAVLEQSLAETVKRGEGFIGPEHLLLAILGSEKGGAVRTLAGLGVEPDEIRRRLEELLDDTTKPEVAGHSTHEFHAREGRRSPDPEAVSLLDANRAAPVNAAVAASVLSDDADAPADAVQAVEIDHSD